MDEARKYAAGAVLAKLKSIENDIRRQESLLIPEQLPDVWPSTQKIKTVSDILFSWILLFLLLCFVDFSK